MPLTNFAETMFADALYGRRSSYFLNNIPGTLYFGLLAALPNEDGLNGVELALSRAAVANTGSAAAATGTFTLTGVPIANETVVIGGVTYIWKSSVSTTANEVKIGADATETRDNLIAAINGGAGSGTLYGSSTVAHTSVLAAAAGSGTAVVVTAKAYGVGGNSIATTETSTNASWGGGTLSGGAASGTFLPTPTLTTGSLVKGVKTNATQINFAAPGSNVGDAIGWGVWDAPAGGTLLLYGNLKNGPRGIQADDAMRFEPGAFELTFLPAAGQPDSGLSLFMQRFFLDSLFGRTATYTLPSNLYYAFMTAMPGVDEGLDPGTELAIGTDNYSRAVVPNDETRWTAASSGRKTNAVQIVWPVVSTNNWTSVVGVCGYDASTGGNLLVKLPFAGAARTFTVGDPPRYAAGAYGVQVD